MNQCFERFKAHKGCGFLFLVLIIFLITVIVYFAVGIQNKIKEGKYIGKEIESKNTITVSDTGEIYAKPDLALTTITVTNEAKTVAKAMADNTKKINSVIDFLKKQGIEEKDLKTANFNISPRYEWIKGEDMALYPEGKRTLVGYAVYQSVQVKIRDMEKIGDIIQGATDAGANQIGDLQFIVDKEDEFKKQAREEAIKKAKEKAKELASQLGVDLVRITNFSESGETPRLMYYEATAKSVGGGGEMSAPSIQTGENKISVSVSITYEIN